MNWTDLIIYVVAGILIYKCGYSNGRYDTMDDILEMFNDILNEHRNTKENPSM